MRWFELFAAVLILGFVSHRELISANPVNELYYDVSPTDWESLQQALLDAGPLDRRGVRRFALTTWKMKWDWERRSDGTPVYSSATVTPEVTMVLPRWKEIIHQPARIQKQWNDFISKVRAHEDSHARIALEGASSLERELRSALTATDATTMIREMKARVERANIAFDQSNDHDREILTALITAR